MAEELGKVHLVNAALIELGVTPNFSIAAQDDLSAIVAVQWPRAVARAFALHDWHFCRRPDRLAQLNGAPINGWSYGYAMPGDRIGGPLALHRTANCRNPIRRFGLAGQNVYCDEPEAWGIFKVPVDPLIWDAAFADAFVVLLASMLAKPVKQDANAAAELSAQALGEPREGETGGMFGRLIAQDRASEPMDDTLYADDPLTAAHGGAWHGGF